uniref:Uncharacterized protein n=1 Tax=Noccaea caerulescens TaxID=107243 RepID=A0A1J3EZ20_NOCCA
MLWFCFKCWRNQHGYPNPMFERLLRVMHFVYLRDIKPKKGVFKNNSNSAQWSLMSCVLAHSNKCFHVFYRVFLVVIESFQV